MRKRMTKKERFVRYLRRTLPNKIGAILMIAMGVIATMIGDDATALVFILMLAIPIFFAWDQVIF